MLKVAVKVGRAGELSDNFVGFWSVFVENINYSCDL